jgi:hypothetical protein
MMEHQQDTDPSVGKPGDDVQPPERPSALQWDHRATFLKPSKLRLREASSFCADLGPTLGASSWSLMRAGTQGLR